MPKNEEILSHVGEARRSFVRKIVVGTSFVAPLVASFSMDSHKAAAAGYNLTPNLSEQGILACFQAFAQNGNFQQLIACIRSKL